MPLSPRKQANTAVAPKLAGDEFQAMDFRASLVTISALPALFRRIEKPNCPHKTLARQNLQGEIMQLSVFAYRQEKHPNFAARTLHVVIAGLMILAATSLPLLAQSQGHAQLRGSTTARTVTITSLPDRVPKNSYFYVLAQDLAVQAECSTDECQATAPVFTPEIPCPAAAGKTCTYFIQVSAQVSETPNDFGEYRFLVDGVPPIQFQTDFNGYFNWEQQNPNAGLGIWEARSYAVVATVKNDVAGQKHSVEVDIACLDVTGDGCQGAFGFGNLRVDVLAP
jgi:hypothetical protein